MTSRPRGPSRLPVRGTISLVGTVGALVLLVSFRGTPAPIGDSHRATDAEAQATEEMITGSTGPGVSDSASEAAGGLVIVTGDRFETRWGGVQVSVTVDGEDVVDVQALALPDGDRRSAQLSDHVESILREEAIAVDCADVSVISGATYTSRAYAASLQSALDQIDAVAPPRMANEVTPVEPADEPPPAVSTDLAVTVTGDTIDTRWGAIQVAVTVSGDDILDVVALDLPDRRGRSARISDHVESILREEAIAVDCADVSVISGATSTSRAYAASLQSALDRIG